MAKIEILELNSISEKEYTRIVCVTRDKKKWIYSRMKGKNTWEIPGGHVEHGENWRTAAERELYEEAGVVKANIESICVYKISKYALLCFAEVIELTDLPNYEMAEIGFFDNEPQLLSYPEAHKLFFEVIKSKKKL